MGLLDCTLSIRCFFMNRKVYSYKNRLFSTRTVKYNLMTLSAVLIISTLVISYALVSGSSSTQLTKAAQPETQFRVDIAYAYTGKWTANISHTDFGDHLMSPVSQYPSAIKLNITRLPGSNIESCDAILEVYSVKVQTNTGQFEQFAYAIGTNYTAFNPLKIQSLVSHMDDIVDKTEYSGGYEGTISLNWTDNESMMTNAFGSACYCSSHNASLGLWKSGTPSTVFVSVSRIGYITMNGDTVTVYKDAAPNTAAAAQLGNHEDGFLYNSIVPASELPQTNLFAPTASQSTPSD